MTIIAYADATKITLEEEAARWRAFEACTEDGEHVTDLAALEALIRGQSVVMEKVAQVSHGGLPYVELLGITPVDSPNKAFLWISLCKGVDWMECCMAQEFGAADFLDQQTYNAR
ncbi:MULTISPECIES: hypothetical protein [unclassified Ensifer]|uniref:hypothetical protein n=1 Tax=unclassified Ensifer TaxID=2633371 RepID=UPI0008131E40|nr:MULTISPECIES: hypothetical protein [unclassified Ensifer]OCP21932.1 hypothetical protein BC361_25525 [Ensifer sp. LC54]OCP23288.1 hypothetical protein BC363_25240 [Ensifer sp. LC384]